MFMLLILLSALAAAHADCDACIQGLCYSKKVLIEGYSITDQLAIDRTNNILYAQLDHRTTAFFLDEAKLRAVHDENTTGLAVDQETQTLYTSLDGAIHAYKYQQGGYTNDVFLILDRPTTPARLRYEDVLYMINKDGSCAYRKKFYNYIEGYDTVEHFSVTDMANVKNICTWFFVSDNKLYKYSCVGRKTWQLISDNKHVLSIGKDGDVYFVDSSQKIIYILDRGTTELKKYGSYVDGSVEDFVFDRDENIVFVDADGNVARWMPTEEKCVEPHRIDRNKLPWNDIYVDRNADPEGSSSETNRYYTYGRVMEDRSESEEREGQYN